MVKKYVEKFMSPGRVERIPMEKPERVGAQFVDPAATEKLDVAMGDQASELDTKGTKVQDDSK